MRIRPRTLKARDLLNWEKKNAVKVLFVSNNDGSGGAARGMLRQMKLLSASKIIECQALVVSKSNEKNPGVHKANLTRHSKMRATSVRAIQHVFKKGKKDFMPSALALFETGIYKDINNSGADLVVYHWFGHNTLGIRELRKVKIPGVFFLHDMWHISGVYHYRFDKNQLELFKDIYSQNKLKKFLEPIIFKVKRSSYRNILGAIAPTKWMKSKALESGAFSESQLEILLNPIEMDIWKPLQKAKFAQKQTFCMVAHGGEQQSIKGFFLLRKSIEILDRMLVDAGRIDIRPHFCIAGGKKGSEELGNCSIEYVGRLGNQELVKLYKKSAISIVPSILENQAQILPESMLCGTPVIAFENTGAAELIENKVNGLLVSYASPEELATSLFEVLTEKIEVDLLSKNAALTAKEFDPTLLLGKYESALLKFASANKRPST